MVALASALAYGAAPVPPSGTAYVPASDGTVLQRVPRASDPGVADMAKARLRWAQSPRDVAAATSLAQTYLAFGRRVGDAHYAGYAEAVISPWVTSGAPPASVLVLQATVMQVRHEFEPARKALREAIRREPRNAQAWLTLATLDIVQGRYVDARRGCAEAGRHGGFVLALACNAHLGSYTGQARTARPVLESALADGRRLDAELTAWLEGLLAETCERLGAWREAEAHYRAALAAAPGDNYLLVAYADLLLDQNRAGEVISMLAPYAASDTAFLRLALAHVAVKSPDAARFVWTMNARFEGLAQRGSDYFGREQARFALTLLKDPPRALDLARRNFEVQREPMDARILMEAALAAGAPSAAREAVAFVRAAGLEDPRIASLTARLEARE